MDEAPARFVADRMLQRLARWLRLMGADVICDAALSGAQALRLAREQGRVMLTRDKRLRTAPDALYIQSQLFRDQLREVIARYPFDARRAAFTRCANCNEPLHEVSREAVVRRVPPFVYAAHAKFAICDHCDHVYWDATHREHALREIAALGR
jgi:uncharacterized protein with PIN domain